MEGLDGEGKSLTGSELLGEVRSDSPAADLKAEKRRAESPTTTVSPGSSLKVCSLACLQSNITSSCMIRKNISPSFSFGSNPYVVICDIH